MTPRRMVTDMYVFDLKTLVWEKVVAPADDCTPAQRYFHSADYCEHHHSPTRLSLLILTTGFRQGFNISSYLVAWALSQGPTTTRRISAS